MKTLEEYFHENCQQGVIDHAIRASVDDRGVVTFYIHSHGKDSDTLDFQVSGNALVPDPRITRPVAPPAPEAEALVERLRESCKNLSFTTGPCEGPRKCVICQAADALTTSAPTPTQGRAYLQCDEHRIPCGDFCWKCVRDAYARGKAVSRPGEAE